MNEYFTNKKVKKILFWKLIHASEKHLFMFVEFIQKYTNNLVIYIVYFMLTLLNYFELNE